MDAYAEAEKMGIKMQKKWIATNDDRTRHSHAELNGEIVETDAELSNGLKYPGDPDGEPAEVYNCRCRMVSVINGYEGNGRTVVKDPETGLWKRMQNQTYDEWIKAKTDLENSTNSGKIKEKKRRFLGRKLENPLVRNHRHIQILLTH